MPRIMGVDIPNEKRIDVSLRYLYGVGEYRAKQICSETGINPATRARELKDEELARIASFIEKNYNDEVFKDGRSGPVEGGLRRKLQIGITRLKKIASYRGMRHIKGLPVRGQRTKTNARTRKGRKKTVAGKVSVKAMK
jgi:small subunit ribosomal protein S13